MSGQSGINNTVSKHSTLKVKTTVTVVQPEVCVNSSVFLFQPKVYESKSANSASEKKSDKVVCLSIQKKGKSRRSFLFLRFCLDSVGV